MTAHPIPPDRQAVQDATRARMMPPIRLVQAGNEAAEVAYRWYWSLPEKERAQVDRLREESRKEHHYVD